jgi:phage-related minor tail protein
VSAELERLAVRLREIAGQLGDPSLADDRLEELARQAAELAAQAGSEAEAALRDAAGSSDE